MNQKEKLQDIKNFIENDCNSNIIEIDENNLSEDATSLFKNIAHELNNKKKVIISINSNLSVIQVINNEIKISKFN